MSQPVDGEFQMCCNRPGKNSRSCNSSRIRIYAQVHPGTEHTVAVNRIDTARDWEVARSRRAESRRHRCLIQPTTVPLPSIRTEIRASAAWVNARVRRAPVQPRMRSVTVVVALEIEELHLQISGRPEQGAVQAFAPNGADQPFNEWMRQRHIRDGLDFLHVEYSKIPLPLVEPIQRIMVRADVGRRGVAASRAIEHPAQRHAINHAAMYAKPTMRRVHWSITTSTQWMRRTADSHRNRSRLHRLSFA